MKVLWSETALSELDDIFAYILDRHQSSASSVAKRIVERARSLGDFPLSGRATNLPGIRMIPVVNYPYVIFYQLDSAAGDVLILNVIHTARNKPPTEDRI